MVAPQKRRCPDCNTEFAPTEFPNPGKCHGCGKDYSWASGTGPDGKVYYIIEWTAQPQ